MTRSAIVTGGGDGIGAAICEALADAGYRVGILDRSSAGAAAVAAAIGGQALVADVIDELEVAAAFDAFGTVPDLVVNNAGIVRFGPLAEASVADFRAVLEVNLVGAYIVAREAARRMLPLGRGQVIAITSVNAVHPGSGAGAYPASKAALAHLTRQFALECGPQGLRFNAIAPGFIDGGMSTPIYADPRVRALRSSGVPSRRLGTPDDVAQAVLFLDSAGATYVNGHELVIDGGLVHSVLMQLPRD
jgi:3-oxoacyl-[acyl-carrier protein] reductase